MNDPDLGQKLAELRTAFDEAFASPPAQRDDDFLRIILIKAGGKRYGLRITELAGLETNRKVVPVPANVPGLRGLSAVRGELVAVYDLASIVGAGTPNLAPRWIALPRGSEPIGLAFEDFEGYRRIAAQAVHALDQASETGLLSRLAIQVDSGRVHILDLPAIASSIGPGGKKQPEREI